MFFSSKKSILGVDIGTTNIKIAQVTTENDRHILDTYGLVDIAFEVDDHNQQSIDQTVSVLKALVQKAGVTTKKIVASLPNSAVFTSVIEMPALDESELRTAVEFEAKKYVPLPMTEVTLSWTVVQKGTDGKSTVLITAVPNAVLRSYLKIFELSKLEPLALEIEALALIRSVVGASTGNELLVDVGAKSTHLNITENGNLVLTRNISVGGQTITEKISEALHISISRAEQFKKEFGINQSSMIPETIKPILLTIKQEIMQLQSIYRARNKGFDKIMLVGGGSNLPGLTEFLSDLGPEVQRGDVLSKLIFNPELKPLLTQYQDNLAVAIGLALRTSK